MPDDMTELPQPMIHDALTTRARVVHGAPDTSYHAQPTDVLLPQSKTELEKASGLVAVEELTRVALHMLPGTELPDVQRTWGSRLGHAAGTLAQGAAIGLAAYNAMNGQPAIDPAVAFAYTSGRLLSETSANIGAMPVLRGREGQLKSREAIYTQQMSQYETAKREFDINRQKGIETVKPEQPAQPQRVRIELGDERKEVQSAVKIASIVAENLLPTPLFGRIIERSQYSVQHNTAIATEAGGAALVTTGLVSGNETQVLTGLAVYGIGKARSRYIEHIASGGQSISAFLKSIPERTLPNGKRQEFRDAVDANRNLQQAEQIQRENAELGRRLAEQSSQPVIQNEPQTPSETRPIDLEQQQARERFLAKIEGRSIDQTSPVQDTKSDTQQWEENDYAEIMRKPISDDEAHMYLQKNARYLTPDMRRLAVNSINQDRAIPVLVQESVQYKKRIEQERIQDADEDREVVIQEAVDAGDSEAASLAYLGGPERKLTDNEMLDAELEGSRFPDGSAIPEQRKQEARDAIAKIRSWRDDGTHNNGEEAKPGLIDRALKEPIAYMVGEDAQEREMELFITENHLNSEEAERARAVRRSGARLSLENIRRQEPESIDPHPASDPQSGPLTVAEKEAVINEEAKPQDKSFWDNLKGWFKEHIRTEGNGLSANQAQSGVLLENTAPVATETRVAQDENNGIARETPTTSSVSSAETVLLKAPDNLPYDKSEIYTATLARRNGAPSIFTRDEESPIKNTGAMPLDEDQFYIWRERAETKGIYTPDQLRKIESTYRSTGRVANEMYWPVIPLKDEQREQAFRKNEAYNSKVSEELRNRVVGEDEFRKRVLQDYPTAEGTIAATTLWRQSGRMPTGEEVKAYISANTDDLSKQVTSWDARKDASQQREVGVSNGQ